MEYNYTKKSLWKWILLYVLIGAIVYGLIWYFFLYNNGGYNNNSQYPISNSQNETADWKTYSNTQEKFSFDYPSSWIQTNTNNIDNHGVIFSGEEGYIQVGKGVVYASCSNKPEEILVGNKQFGGSCHVKSSDSEEWLIMDNDFGMIAHASKPYLSNRAVILKILSTFKFTD